MYISFSSPTWHPESCPEMTVALRREAASEDKGQLLTAEVSPGLFIP